MSHWERGQGLWCQSPYHLVRMLSLRRIRPLHPFLSFPFSFFPLFFYLFPGATMHPFVLLLCPLLPASSAHSSLAACFYPGSHHPLLLSPPLSFPSPFPPLAFFSPRLHCPPLSPWVPLSPSLSVCSSSHIPQIPVVSFFHIYEAIYEAPC